MAFKHVKSSRNIHGVRRHPTLFHTRLWFPRVDYLYRKQIRLMMDELRVPVLDVFEASYLSADWTLPGDGRHYDLAYNKMVLSWYYPPDNYTDS